MNFAKRVEQMAAGDRGACWLWGGSKGDGYGTVMWDGRVHKAHRLAYTLLIGPIPEGLVLDHVCTERSCYNPYHCQPVTRAINNQRRGDRREACKYGHPWTPENTRLVRTSPTSIARWCNECGRQRSRKYMRTKHGYATQRVAD
jgi:hypothetical protein